jgi:predicted pyridoxine 5'-phosphate oxidase superfamily flavin-nucleotide-binding protein
MLTAPMKDPIATFPLGFVASVTPDGAPAVSLKGTFLVLDDHSLAFRDTRSPGTRQNLIANPAIEVNFIDPFKRQAVRVAGTTVIHPKGSNWLDAQYPIWLDVFGGLAKRIQSFVAIKI